MKNKPIYLKERLSELNPEAKIFDDLDGAIVGLAENGKGIIAVYDNDAILKIFMDRDGMTDEDVQDYIDFNIIRSLPYMGEYAPVIMFMRDERRMKK